MSWAEEQDGRARAILAGDRAAVEGRIGLLERVAIVLCGRWSSRLLAARLGQKNDRSIRRWRAGAREVPVQAWRDLDRLLAGAGQRGAYLRPEVAAEISRLERGEGSK